MIHKLDYIILTLSLGLTMVLVEWKTRPELRTPRGYAALNAIAYTLCCAQILRKVLK